MVRNHSKKKKGQVTLEFILLVAAIVAILIVFLNPNGGVFSTALNQTFQQGTNGMQNMAARLSGSRNTP